MIGGPTDVVVEPNIVRAAAAREPRQPRPARSTPPMRAARVAAADARTWPLQPAASRRCAATPRPLRGNVTDEPWRRLGAAGSRAAARAAPRAGRHLTGLAAEFSSRRERIRFHARSRRQTPPRANRRAVVPPPPPARAAPRRRRPISNLAEMAQRLEAALRRPTAADHRRLVDRPARRRAERQGGREDRAESRAASSRRGRRAEAGADAPRRPTEPLRQPRTGDGELARPSTRKNLTTARSAACVRLTTVAAG